MAKNMTKAAKPEQERIRELTLGNAGKKCVLNPGSKAATRQWQCKVGT
jgi:hypothetical protein